MTAELISFRPLPFSEPPDSLIRLLGAVEDMPDATVMRLIDQHFPEAGAFLRSGLSEPDPSATRLALWPGLGEPVGLDDAPSVQPRGMTNG